MIRVGVSGPRARAFGRLRRNAHERGHVIDKPFISDHCSAVAEYDHAECCVIHDWAYWRGGSRRDRKRADKAFYDCMRATATRRLAWQRWMGVRVFGVGFLPLPWRWGYGWRYPRTKPQSPDNSQFTVENQRDAYEAIRANAAEADRLAKG